MSSPETYREPKGQGPGAIMGAQWPPRACTAAKDRSHPGTPLSDLHLRKQSVSK